LQKEIDDTLEATLKFAADVHAGVVKAANGEKFTRVLVVGIPDIADDDFYPMDEPLISQAA
jgi:hypothetical protein